MIFADVYDLTQTPIWGPLFCFAVIVGIAFFALTFLRSIFRDDR